MRISDWSSDVCSSDLTAFEFVTDRLGAQGTVLGGGRYDGLIEALGGPPTAAVGWAAGIERLAMLVEPERSERVDFGVFSEVRELDQLAVGVATALRRNGFTRSEEHTSELQSLMRISYAVFCLKKK